MLWLTSDSHFDHPGIIDHCKRPFSSVEEMNEALIERWNARVGPRDTVYHLGDLSLGKPADLMVHLARLTGRICLVRGNHDEWSNKWERELSKRFEWIKDYHVLRHEKKRVIFSHFPFLTWRNAQKGAWHCHGHSHGSIKEGVHDAALEKAAQLCDGLANLGQREAIPFERARGFREGAFAIRKLKSGLLTTRLDVGVDCHDFAPLAWDEMCAIMEEREYQVVDHHVPRERGEADG